MTIYEIDPTTDERWSELLLRHPSASIFHTAGWLRALRDTYGYRPVAITTSRPGAELENALPFCEVRSWLTGCRLISLPFSDHCAPLVDHPQHLSDLLNYAEHRTTSGGWRYFELRSAPELQDNTGFTRSQTSVLHLIDLNRELDEIAAGFHRDCISRKIQRALHAHVVCEQGRSEAVLGKFYSLLLITRRRQGLPAQPKAWFHRLIEDMGSQLQIIIASKDGKPIAGILTLRLKQTLVYKYGCSDHSVNNLGGNQLLLWTAIQKAKSEGLTQLDMGRSETNNPGLIAYKDRWGAQRTQLSYLRLSVGNLPVAYQKEQFAFTKNLRSRIPLGLVAALGKALYRHAA